jgi:hypothetical protein
MMITSLEANLQYIPFAQIDWVDAPYQFRLANADREQALKSSLYRSGQTHPALFERVAPDRYRVLDGHRRCQAVHRIRESGGTWEKVLGHIINSEHLSPTERFHLIFARNAGADTAYGLVEMGRLMAAFKQAGFSVAHMASVSGRSVQDVDDLVLVAEAPSPLADLVNPLSLEPAWVAMLVRRYNAWIQSDFRAEAPAIATRLLAHAADERLTVRSWKFLLDFYWSHDRPFMTFR